MPRPILMSRHRAAAAAAVAVVVAVGLGVPGLGLRSAVAQEECDARCWAILAYLADQGLTPEQIEDLGDSGIEPDEDTPTITPGEDGGYTVSPPATTTTPPATTTAPPVTTTAPPATTGPAVWQPPTVPPTEPPISSGECDPATTWACDEVNAGIADGYLPDGFNPHDDVDTQDLLQIIEDFGDQNPDFDAQAALLALQNAGAETDRGEMFNAIAAGLGIPYDPGSPLEVADELGDLGIVWGHDGDPTDNSQPGDADPDGKLSNAALAALLDRVQDHTGGEHSGPAGPTVSQPTGGGTATPVPETCAADLVLTPGERSLLTAQLRWQTLVRIESQGEPGVSWPPHPDVPGGAEFLVVSKSPVWPVVDAGARWEAAYQDDGCVWVASHVETQVSQMLPWRSEHRRVLENSSKFDLYVQRWDSLSPSQKAQAIQRHRNGDIDTQCPLEAAMVGEDAYDQCRWELPEPGVWSWRARACFEAEAGDALYRDCVILAQGTEWFLRIIDYTSGITARAGPGATAGHRAHSAPVD